MPEQGDRGKGAIAPPPIFGRSIYPIPTGGARFCPPFTTGTPKFFHLPASLDISNRQKFELLKTDLIKKAFQTHLARQEAKEDSAT